MDVIKIVLAGVPTTLTLTFGALAIGSVGAVPLTLGRTSKNKLVAFFAGFLIDFIRGIPPIVWLFILFFGISTDIVQMSPLVTGVLGLGIISSAYLAEIFRGGIISVHKGQHEAATALGLGPAHVFGLVVAPQAVRSAWPAASTYAIGLLKDSSIASTIGVSEIVFRANADAQAHLRPLESFAAAGVVYLVISLGVAWLTRKQDVRLQQGVA